jgi:hypothetical protein
LSRAQRVAPPNIGFQAEHAKGASQFLAVALAAVVAAGFQAAEKPGILPGGVGPAMTPALNFRLVPGGWKPPSTATRMVAATRDDAQAFRRMQESEMHPTPTRLGAEVDAPGIRVQVSQVEVTNRQPGFPLAWRYGRPCP